MDGREFVNMPPLGRSGLPLEMGGVPSGSTGGRFIPSTGQLAPFCPAKYFPTPHGLHSQPGFSDFGRGVYHSYIPISHLDPSAGLSPLLTHMGPHSLIESQKDRFCFSGQQSTYHTPTSMLKTSSNQTQSSHLHEKDPVCHSHKNPKEASKDTQEKVCRNELLVSSCLQGTSKKDRRIAEDTQSGDLVDRNLESKVERERKKSGLHRVLKIGEQNSPFIPELVPNRLSGNIETKSKHHQISLLNNCNQGGYSLAKPHGSEEDGCAKDQNRHDETIRPLCYTSSSEAKRSESVVTSSPEVGMPCSCPSSQSSNFLCKLSTTSSLPTQTINSSIYSIIPQVKEMTSELQLLASTIGHTVDAIDEQSDTLQVVLQSCESKSKASNLEEKAEFSLPHFHQDCSTTEPKSVDFFREQRSVICCNNSLKCKDLSDSSFNTPEHTSLEKRTFVSSTVPAPCRQGERSKETCKVSGLIDTLQQHSRHSFVKLPEHKVKHLQIGNCNTSQVAVLAAQHSQVSHGKEESKKLCAESKTFGPSKTSSETQQSSAYCERSAMQSLIKYSGNFAKEADAWQSSSMKSPFGGLGNMKLNEPQLKTVKVQSISQPEVKKDPDRLGSAKSVTKDIVGFQGEIEVRNPPVGIAVAVARQKDSTGNKMISSKGHAREENMDERMKHCNERLLIEKFDREQAKLLRENKDLPDISQIHSSGCAGIGLSSNLMVTGGTPLSALGPWAADSKSHLLNPWLPTGVIPCMWHADHPHGLSHPTFHQTMNPAIPQGVSASFPSAYSFARDPQNGQIVLIPAEHLTHFGMYKESRLLHCISL